MRNNFVKLSAFVTLIAVLVIAGAAGITAQASNPAQSTDSATMAATEAGTPADSGAITECPDVIPQPTAEATDSATMAATMAPATMMATAAAAAATPSPMTLGAFTTTVGCSLEVTLAGENEVPAAPKTGKGDATLIVSRPATGPGEICFLIDVGGIKLPATASHIHVGVEGVAGPVIVTLVAPGAAGRSSGCITGVDRQLIEDLVTEPYNYYVNVHTTDYPEGAARGQLHSPAQD
jgi:hypothetical protein